MSVGVEHHARRAGAGIGGYLKVLDIRVEGSRVEGDARELGLHARFIVPQRLVVITIEAAIGRLVVGAAQGLVPGIVDAAEPEALGGLGVAGDIVASLIATQHARDRKSVVSGKSVS